MKGLSSDYSKPTKKEEGQEAWPCVLLDVDGWSLQGKQAKQASKGKQALYGDDR